MVLMHLTPLDFYPRFCHITEQIFEQLDNVSICKCREVSTVWKDCIDNKNISWIRIIDIPSTEDNWRLRKYLTPFHIACRFGLFKISKLIIEKSSELNIDLNAKGTYGKTPFHLACEYGHLSVADLIMKNSLEFKIDLSASCKFWRMGQTALHLACYNGHSKIAELIILKAGQLKIDVNKRDGECKRAIHEACSNGLIDVVQLLIKKSKEFKIDMNTRGYYERTGFS